MRKLFTLAIGIFICFHLAADDKASREYTVHRASTPIKINGIPDEKAWLDVADSPVFAEIEKGGVAPYPVTAKMLWDDKCLYISFRISAPNVWALNVLRDFPMAGQQLPSAFMLKNREFKGNTKYTEDFVEVFLDPDNDGRNYTETHVNPLNTVCDKWQETPRREDVCKRMGIEYPKEVKIHPSWDCPGLKTAVHINGTLNDPYDADEGWTVEMAIPFESLKHLSQTQNFPPNVGDKWRVHLARRYVPEFGNEATYLAWPVIGVADCHTPDRWGYVTFAGAREKSPDKNETGNTDFSNDGVAKKEPDLLGKLPKGDFEWRALWARSIKTHKEADELISLTKAMNCNVLIIYAEGYGKAMYDSKTLSPEKNVEEDTLKYLIGQAHKNNIGAYAWVVNLLVSPEFAGKHPELMQKVRDWEEDNAKLPRVDPGRENIHGGNWLCPDHGLTEHEKNIFCEIVTEFDFDGLALDYIGYRNYYGCFCESSIVKRQEFADKHPELSAFEIMRQFSENSMVRYVEEIRNSVKAMKKDIKFTIHIYPDFDLNPAYANRLPIEYCGQTITWFYKPFWSYGKIYDTCMMYKKAEGNFFGYNKFVPFIGAYPDDKLKSEERLRKEIRIAGLAKNGTIMFAFAQTFLKHPELAKIVADELSNRPNEKLGENN